MTSPKQIAANRRNASRSTGPVTAQGKARASRNALRHGLSVPVYRAAAVAADSGEFALQLVGHAASQTEIDLARAAAEAQLELVRIRREKQLLLEVLMWSVSSPDIEAIRRLDRYERRAKSRRKRALSELSKLCRLPSFGSTRAAAEAAHKGKRVKHEYSDGDPHGRCRQTSPGGRRT